MAAKLATDVLHTLAQGGSALSKMLYMLYMMYMMHIMIEVPPLLEACQQAWHSSACIKCFWLVSKELGPKLALSAVRLLSVQVGDGALPSQNQVMHLVAHAQLQQLAVAVIIRAGALQTSHRKYTTFT